MASHEAHAVDEVRAALYRVGARAQVNRGRDGDDARERRREVRAVVARELQDHVAAHREARDVDARESLAPREFFDDDAFSVAPHAAVVERLREALRPAAVAHVHPHYVEARAVSLARSAYDVERLARTFEPVQQKNRRRFPALPLPATLQKHAHIPLDFDETRLV